MIVVLVSTGKSVLPSKLIFGTVIKDKIPEVALVLHDWNALAFNTIKIILSVLSVRCSHKNCQISLSPSEVLKSTQ